VHHVLVWLAVFISYPLLKWFPSDIMVVLAVADQTRREA
jgi:hypothetical protein